MASSNPFNPSWGTRPPVLAGREALLEAVFEGLSDGPGWDTFHHVLYGARGVGKTVLLAEIADHVSERGWAVMRYSGSHEQSPGAALMEAAPRLQRALGGRRLRIEAEVEVTPPIPGRPVSASVRAGASDEAAFIPVLRRLGERAAKRKVGVLFVVDELQRTRPTDLGLLGDTVQLLERNEGLPVSLALAGLYTTPAHLSAACTFLERQDKTEVGALSADATRLAFLEPFSRAGMRVEEPALDALVAASAGYPFAIQLYGKHAWAMAADGVVSTEVVEAAAEDSRRWLEVNLYEPRWERLSGVERAMVKAVAAVGGDAVAVGAVAAAVGRTTTQLSTAREALIVDHHVLHSPRYGFLAFDLPGFDAWVRETQDMGHLALPPVGGLGVPDSPRPPGLDVDF